MSGMSDLTDEIEELREILSRIIMDGQVPVYVGSNRWEWMTVTMTESSSEPLDNAVDPAHAAVIERACEQS